MLTVTEAYNDYAERLLVRRTEFIDTELGITRDPEDPEDFHLVKREKSFSYENYKNFPN